ncbi:C2D1A protein, partial [Thryothorus ludovicianus]|nr:C2D1A protein [Thryothorus ludovicianus]
QGDPGEPVLLQEPVGPGTLLEELSERAELYRAALGNAVGESGNGARLRRLQRGLKTLEQMLESVRSGKQINEAEIPPLVALGRGGGAPGSLPPGSPELPVQPPAPPQPPPAPDPSPDPSSVP